MAKQSANPQDSSASRLEKILAYMSAGLIGTSVLAMLATLIIAATESANPEVGSSVLPPFLVFYPQFGLAAGALCIVSLVITSVRRRSRENK
ncbi:hypothetical protein [Rhodoluna limnophila]|uniref:hypothetical protein n=1 Tax=Rhodoluna limnophila TaxID=232537 RepID=UPI0011061F71|nr:hypothetical protein [Rhodoluna limnophila]